MWLLDDDLDRAHGSDVIAGSGRLVDSDDDVVGAIDKSVGRRHRIGFQRDATGASGTRRCADGSGIGRTLHRLMFVEPQSNIDAKADKPDEERQDEGNGDEDVAGLASSKAKEEMSTA